MGTLYQDIRFAYRMLSKRPGFTAIALITLAIGIGANTIMFSISDLLLIQPPRKVKSRDQLAVFSIKDEDGFAVRFPYSEYLTLRDSGLAFSDLLAEGVGLDSTFASLVHGDWARQVRNRYVSANYFTGLGDNLVRGRGFLPEEERRGSAPVVVLAHNLWQRLGSDPKLIGEYITLNSTRCQVVGVAVKGFGGITFGGPELWLPLGSYWTVANFDPAWHDGRKELRLNIVGRLKPEVTMSVAQAQLKALIPQFKREYREHWKPWSSITLRAPGRTGLHGDDERMIQVWTVSSGVFMAVSAIILAIGCLNLANMLIVQGAARQREIAIRRALGGSRWCIIRQLLTESLLLALLGGVLGVLLAFWGTRIVNIWVIPHYFRGVTTFECGLSLRVLAGTLGLCLITSLLFGLKPALRLSKSDIVGEMKASGSSVLGSLRRKRGAVSVTGQIALSVTLMLIATLLTRSALEIAKPEARVSLEDKLVVHIDSRSAGFDPVKIHQTGAALADHLLSLPEVKALGTSSKLFYGGSGPIVISEYLSESGRPLARKAAMTWIGRDYFTAMEIPLLQGRLFNQLDYAPNAPEVAIIDESLARKLRPDGNALDCIIKWGFTVKSDADPCRVVGIVAHLPNLEDGQAHAQMYAPHKTNRMHPYLYLHVANKGLVDGLRQRIIAEIHRVDARISVKWVKTLAQIHNSHDSVKRARIGARVGLTAGATALFLAALGIYAIKGYMVASRTSEIGIRMALGATHGDIIGMVLRGGLVLTMVGLMVGLLLGLGVAKVSASMLYGVRPVDPVSIVATVALLGAASLLASYLPARRAAKVDPMVALRHE
ncbi:MAG: ADOP family duplicated permease [Planctomycetota bacterium]|jgi:predicted permease